MRALVCTALSLAFAPLSALAGVVHVSPTGPIATIQAGVDAATAGDTVQVKAGVYRENVVIGSSKTGLTLAAGGAVVVDARGDSGFAAGAGIDVLADAVTIKGVTVRHASTDQANLGDGFRVAAAGFTARNCTALHCETAGFHLIGCAGATLTHCTLRANDVGVNATSSTDLVVAKCTLEDTIDGGIVLFDFANAEIRDCRFVGWVNVRGGIDANNDASAGGLRVLHCRFELGNFAAVGIDSPDVEITGCRVESTRNGFDVQGDGCDIAANRLERLIDDSEAISVGSSADASIHDNRVRSCAEDPVFLTFCTGADVRDNDLANCAFESFDAGVFLSGCTDCVFRGNKIRDANDGILMFLGCQGCDFLDNDVRACSRDGFSVADDSEATTIDGNLVVRCLGQGVDHRGTNGVIRNNVLKKSRLDLTNSGTATFADNAFKTGGENVPAEIEP